MNVLFTVTIVLLICPTMSSVYYKMMMSLSAMIRLLSSLLLMRNMQAWCRLISQMLMILNWNYWSVHWRQVCCHLNHKLTLSTMKGNLWGKQFVNTRLDSLWLWLFTWRQNLVLMLASLPRMSLHSNPTWRGVCTQYCWKKSLTTKRHVSTTCTKGPGNGCKYKRWQPKDAGKCSAVERTDLQQTDLQHSCLSLFCFNLQNTLSLTASKIY